jgi:hypothetical protein
MNSFRIDIANILLMLVSTVVAIILPFEVFLISYAVLGPLHYLTQISWLRQKQYFTLNKNDRLVFLIFCSFVSFFLLIVVCWPLIKDSQLIESALKNLNLDKKIFAVELLRWSSSLIFLVFSLAFILSFFKDWWHKINLCIIALLLSFLFKGVGIFVAIFGILLATIIHVWLFTGIFILSGAVKNKAASSYISFAVFLICSLSFCFISTSDYVLSSYALDAMKSNNNLGMNEILLRIFGSSFDQQDIFYSRSGQKIQSFIAFAYTYHYLNWFSKVEIIKWNKVSKKSLIFSVVIWIVSVALYAYSYRLGFLCLLFLSMMHVFLEFPLDFLAISTLVRSGRKKI